MPFIKNPEGRPSGTAVVEVGKSRKEFIMHYTCNPPNKRALEKNGIIPMGNCLNNAQQVKENSSLEDGEVLLIPVTLMEGRGDPENTVGVENLLRDLDREEYE